MKGIVKILAALLSLGMLLSLAACQKPDGGDTESESESESESAEQTEAVEKTLFLADNGTPLYAIVYEDADYKDVATNMQSTLKTKTGLDFSCLKFAREGVGSIFVGVKPDSLGEDGKVITGYGYGVIEKDGDVYICGYNLENVTKAANGFLTAIVPATHVIKNDDGRTQRVILPEKSIFITNPDYPVKVPKLMSVELDEYRLVTDDGIASAEYELGDMIRKVISLKTGTVIKHVTDKTSETSREIIFGNTSRPESAALKAGLSPDEYVIKSVGGSLYIVLGSYVCFTDALETFHGLYDNGTEENINIKGKAANSYGLERSNPDLVRFMTFNVLIETYDELAISAKKRQYINADCILAYMPDVVGIQEASSFIRPLLAKELSEYYSMIEVVDGTNGDYIYYPVFYRKDLYKVVESRAVSYENNGSDMWGYVWALLESKTDPSKQFILFNTHYPIQDERRQDDFEVCNAELNRLQEAYPTVPLLMTGDFNSNLDSWQHEAIYGDLTNALDSAGRLTEDNVGGHASVDMVLVTKDLVTVDRYRVLKYDAVQYGSDHDPVFADVDVSKK